MNVTCIPVETKKQLDDVLWLRWKVYVEEFGYADRASFFTRREYDAFDTLDTSLQYIAYVDNEPAATVRILTPNPDVAQEAGTSIGLDLEQKFNLSACVAPGRVIGETTRSTVRKEWRNTGILLEVYAAAYRHCMRLGITHWVAAGNTETDHPGDAELVYRIAARRGYTISDWPALPRVQYDPPAQSRYRLYEGVVQNGDDDLMGLYFPRTLGLFAEKIGARFIGPPIYDPGFKMFAMPLCVSMETMPETTRRMFEGNVRQEAAAV